MYANELIIGASIAGLGLAVVLARELTALAGRALAWAGVAAGIILLHLVALAEPALAAQGAGGGVGSILAATLQILGLALLALGWVALVPLVRQWKRERRERKAELRQIRMVTDSVPQLLVSVDCYQRIRYINQTGMIWFGLGPQDAIGGKLSTIMGPEFYETIQAQLEHALTGEPASYDNVPVGEGDSVRHYSICYLPEKDDNANVIGVHIVIDDVTEQLKALQRLHESDVKMAELQVLRKTSATYAHEINSPLTGIMAAADLLGDESMSLEERAEMAADVLDAAKRIKQVTEALEKLQDPMYKDYGVGKAQIIELKLPRERMEQIREEA